MPYQVTATATGGVIGGVGNTTISFAEWGSVTASATDGSNHADTAASSTTFNTGSVTTTANGDLVIGGMRTTSGSGFTHGTGFTLLSSTGNGDAAEYETQTSSGAINPQFGTIVAGSSVTGVTGCFKKSAGAFGTPFNTTSNTAGSTSSLVTPGSTPTAGDFLLAVVSTANWATVNTGFTVTDNNGGVWTQLVFDNGNTGAKLSIAIFYILAVPAPAAGSRNLMLMGCGT